MTRPLTPRSLALVGAACRLPGGADSFEAFTDHCARGLDAIGPAPGWRGFDRLYDPTPGTPGRTPLREGGFLTTDLRDFDPDVFGINAREAASLDPQQRLLLEVALDALHDAGTPPAALDPERTGVYVGISGSEFKVLAQRRDPRWIDPYIGTGVHAGTAAGRIAYSFGWHGETIAVDTACSSGLVAFHLACRAIREGRLDAALVAAVNVLLDPEANVSMASMGTLSVSGRCRTFSARADGYVRSEGAVALLLRATPRAQDRVHAWVLGTACNQDGRSSGLTAPNGRAQQAVMHAGLAEAGIPATEIGYHEAHGSATRLGDAVEIGALASVHRDRHEPLPIGSVKSRIGHLEAAAGLAGVLRAVGVLRTGLIPPSLHADPPNEALDDASQLRVVRTAEPLRGSTVSVSSFGIGGTNAFVVLRAAEPDPARVDSEGWRVLALSAPHEAGLDAAVRAAEATLDTAGSWTDRAATASTGRWPFEHRVAVAARNAEQARAALASARRAVTSGPVRVAFVFPGQGVGGVRMARQLYEADPVARDAIDRCLAAAARVGLADAWWGDDPRWLLRMALVQPAVFAVGWALAQRLRRWGVEPEAVAGHSSGEVAAACFAGVMSVEDAVDLLILRGELLDATPPGKMAAVFASADAVLQHLPPGPVGIAAENHEEETVISGPIDAMESAIDTLTRAGLVVRPLNVARAGHSALLDPQLSAVESWVRAHPLRTPALPLVSTLTGAEITDAITTPTYWARQLREPVRFRAAARTLRTLGIGAVVDLGPHPVLAGAAPQAAPGLVGIGTLHREHDDQEAVHTTLAELWLAGGPLPEAAYDPFRVVNWPSVSYHRRRLWLEGSSEIARARAAGLYTVRWSLADSSPCSNVVYDVPRGLTPEAAVRWAVNQVEDRPLAFRVGDDVSHAAVIGMARAAFRERPGLGCAVAYGDAPVLWGEVSRIRDGVVEVARLAPLYATDTFRTTGVWLVTGGHGALGHHLVRWLEERGAERVVAVSRRSGVDVAQASDIDRVLAEVGPLTGVVHAAGVLRDAALHTIADAQIEEVFAGKVRGAKHLAERLPPEVKLVLLSSFTSLVGGRGQAVYAAANAMLDEVAARRIATGGQAIALNLGPWAGESMAAATLDRRRAEGLPPMAPREALAAIGAALTTDHAQVAVVDLEPEVAAAVPDAPPILADVLGLGPIVVVSRDEWREHAVDGTVVVSAADRLIWAAAGGPLSNVMLPEPWELPETGLATARVRRTADEVVLRADGRVVLSARTGAPWSAPSTTVEAHTPVDLDALYASFHTRGVTHGPSYRRLSEAWRSEQGVIGTLTAEGTAGQKLDAALALAGVYAQGDEAWLPVAIDAVWLNEVGTARKVILRSVRRDAERIVSDVVLYDADGVPVGALRGHTLRRRAAHAAAPNDTLAQVVGITRRVLALAPEAPLDPDRSLIEQGLDSILAVELRNRLVAAGFEVPLHQVMGGASARTLAGVTDAPPVPRPEPAVPTPAAGPDLVLSPAQLAAAFVGAVFGAAIWAAYGALTSGP